MCLLIFILFLIPTPPIPGQPPPGRSTVLLLPALHPAHKVGLIRGAQPAPQKMLKVKGNSVTHKHIG